MEPDRLNSIKRLESAYANHLSRVDSFTTVARAVAGRLSGTTVARDGADLTLFTLGARFTLRFTPDLEGGGAVLHLLHVATDESNGLMQETVGRWVIDKLGNSREDPNQFPVRSIQEPDLVVDVIERAQEHLIAHYNEIANLGETK